jgi:ketosteroid isomerase-like protein
MAADFLKTQYLCAGNYDGVRELGDLAVAWGHESCLETTKASQKTVRTYERWLVVFRRQPDGTWLQSEETFIATDAPGNGP